METNGFSYLLVFLFILGIYFAIMLYLSFYKKNWGLVLPSVFALIAFYNYLKPIISQNPHPTMQEGIYAVFFGTLSLLGFIMFGFVKYIKKRKK